MKIDNLDKMIGGWFIGNFEPSLLKTNDCEVAVKRYNKGDYEGHHYHKIATEYTVIINGRIKMNGIEYGTVNVVVKIPGANNDKYVVK